MNNSEEYNVAVGKAMEELQTLIDQTTRLSITVMYARSRRTWNVTFVNMFWWNNEQAEQDKDYDQYKGVRIERKSLIDAINVAMGIIKDGRVLQFRKGNYREYRFIGKENLYADDFAE